MKNDDLDYNLYVIAELQYQKLHEGEENLFPLDWYSTKDYRYKIEIIAEAIQKNIGIEETESFKNRFLKRKFRSDW